MEVNEETNLGKKWSVPLSELHCSVRDGHATQSEIDEYVKRKEALRKNREKNGGSTNE